MKPTEILVQLKNIQKAEDALRTNKKFLVEELKKSNLDQDTIVKELVTYGCHIDAIRYYRDCHLCSLTDAKKYCDELRDAGKVGRRADLKGLIVEAAMNFRYK